MVHKTVVLDAIDDTEVEKIKAYMNVSLQSKLVEAIEAVANFELEMIDEPMSDEFESLVWIQTTGKKLFYRCKIYYTQDVAFRLYEHARNVPNPNESLVISYL
ncbi:MAG: hypothetical protein HRU09_13890 [Oligoflexales bacterium]|nr:hypothetical protein [Oligoflexales bacterium]